MPSKAIWKSKTFWANIVMGSLVYLNQISPKYSPYIIGAVNLLLRYLTNQPVSLTGK